MRRWGERAHAGPGPPLGWLRADSALQKNEAPMATSNPGPSFSRRTALAGLGAGALGLALATNRLSASAQVATPDATVYPTAGHPITGVWQFDNELRQPGTDISNVVFTNEGNYVAGGVEFGYITVGIWRATGERTAELFFTVQDPTPR